MSSLVLRSPSGLVALGLTSAMAASQEIHTDGFPRAMWFRTQIADSTEQLDFNVDYAAWATRIERLDGICSNRPGWPGANGNSRPFLEQFDDDYPNKFMFAMTNGISRDPSGAYTQASYFAGHWLYFEGSTTLTALTSPSFYADVDIALADEDRFVIGDDIVLRSAMVPPVQSWFTAEHGRILNKVLGATSCTLTIQRALYGSSPGSFPVGSHIAAHVPDPFSLPSNWAYNYWVGGPLDGAGKNCIDVRVQDVLDNFLSSHPDFPDLEGIQFDVLNADPLKFNQTRVIDVDNDGDGDRGVLGDVNVLDEGTATFLAQVRATTEFSNRVITADSQNLRNTRSVGVRNGSESERFPSGQDGLQYLRDWSSGVNRLLFWNAHAVDDPVAFNYINHKFNDINEPLTWNVHRASLAAGPLFGWALTFFEGPDDPGAFPPFLGVFDEMLRGVDDVPNWLGMPNGPLQRLGLDAPDLLGGDGVAMPPSFVSSLVVSGATITRVPPMGGAAPYLVVQPSSASTEVVITYPDLLISDGDLVVFAELWSDPRATSPQLHRVLSMECDGRFLSDPQEAKRFSPDEAHAWVHTESYLAEFYWRDAGGEPGPPVGTRFVDLILRLPVEQGTEPFYIRRVTAHNDSPAMRRSFEGGEVLVNPSLHDYSFAAPVPGTPFRRIQATAHQDGVHNDGSTVTWPLTLSGRDAIFLVRQ